MLVAQLCPSFANPWSVHGILWARILEWIAISFSRGERVSLDCTVLGLRIHAGIKTMLSFHIHRQNLAGITWLYVQSVIQP